VFADFSKSVKLSPLSLKKMARQENLWVNSGSGSSPIEPKKERGRKGEICI